MQFPKNCLVKNINNHIEENQTEQLQKMKLEPTKHDYLNLLTVNNTKQVGNQDVNYLILTALDCLNQSLFNFLLFQDIKHKILNVKNER